MAKLCFHENVDFLPECSEMYAKPESWIPADKHHSEKLGEHNFARSPFSSKLHFSRRLYINSSYGKSCANRLTDQTQYSSWKPSHIE